MKKNLGKIAAAIIIAGVWFYVLFLNMSAKQSIQDSLQSLLPMLCSSCVLLSHVFSTRELPSWPEEMMEDATFAEAKERQETGGKIALTGVLMVVAPLVILLIAQEIGGVLAFLFMLSIGLGILAILMGILVSFSAGKDLAKFNAEMVIDSKPENKVSRFFSALGGIAILIWIVQWFMQR